MGMGPVDYSQESAFIGTSAPATKKEIAEVKKQLHELETQLSNTENIFDKIVLKVRVYNLKENLLQFESPNKYREGLHREAKAASDMLVTIGKFEKALHEATENLDAKIKAAKADKKGGIFTPEGRKLLGEVRQLKELKAEAKGRLAHLASCTHQIWQDHGLQMQTTGIKPATQTASNTK